jgi:hypothetical protein
MAPSSSSTDAPYPKLTISDNNKHQNKDGDLGKSIVISTSEGKGQITFSTATSSSHQINLEAGTAKIELTSSTLESTLAVTGITPANQTGIYARFA